MKRSSRPRRRPASSSVFELRLYVAGQTPKSLTALNNLKRICTQYLDRPYRIDVIDLLNEPHLAREHQILAIPTLVRNLPLPIRKIIGDLSDTEKVVLGLDLSPPPDMMRPAESAAF